MYTIEQWKKEFYFSTKWKKCSELFLKSKLYICERCGEAAEIAHHKTYLTSRNVKDTNISLNWDNLEALCKACHNSEHFGNGQRIPNRYEVDEYGRVKPKDAPLGRNENKG